MDARKADLAAGVDESGITGIFMEPVLDDPRSGS